MQAIHGFLISVLVLIRGAAAWSSTSSLAQQLHRRTSYYHDGRSPNTRLLMAEQEEEEDVAGVESPSKHSGYNVLGTELSCCCSNVGGSGIGTGFYRNGFCATGDMDLGRHTVCVQVTDDFLSFSKGAGNDLSTPVPQYNFPGLNEGDIWCLCAQRWAQAYNAGKAPKLFLKSTHEKTLDFIPLDVLKIFAIDADEANTVMKKLDLDRKQLDELMSKDVAEDGDSFQ